MYQYLIVFTISGCVKVQEKNFTTYSVEDKLERYLQFGL